MASFLLDTDAVIDYLNRYSSTVSMVAALVAQNERLCTCEVVLTEVYAGLYPRDEGAAADFLPALEFLPGSPEVAERAGRWRFQLARMGRVLPFTNALIAATAVQYGATVVTRNIRDYPMPEVSVLALR